MSEKPLAGDPKNEGLIEPTTELRDDEDAEIDPGEDVLDPAFQGGRDAEISLDDTHGQSSEEIVPLEDGNLEEAPGIREASEMSTPTGDPGDLSGGGRSALLPDDLGTGDDPSPDDLTGGDFGSSLLDDLAGDPTDGTGGGGGMPDIEDQTGWAGMGIAGIYQPPKEPLEEDDDDERETQEDDDEPPDTEDQPAGQGGPEYQSMPAPDDGTGGEPDASDFIGGPGNVDPASETEPAGGAGELVGGRGDVDPASETEPAGPAGELIGGRGDIDPFDGKSSLLGDDTGDLAEMAAEADLGDVEIEVDDSLADADVGDDV